jgi:spore maturation protein CgeB
MPMRITIFCHSLRSCWNHGNAHFLRGIVAELIARGHEVEVFEPADAWSVQNLVRDEGGAAVDAFRAAYPQLGSTRYRLDALDLDRALDGSDLVLVHEWNDPALVARIGAHRRTARYRLLFHDTHHRAVTAPHEMAAMDLRDYDGVLAFGDVVRRTYLQRGWAARAWTWHEAADTRVFRPRPAAPASDIVWVGNWGDDERSAELSQFLFAPVRALGLSGAVFGVRYPQEGLAAVRAAGLQHRGWLPNHRVPEVLAAHRVTVHVPRRPYAERLPGIPTIRVFEALACGIPLVSAPWSDAEGLFSPGRDYLVARDGDEMRRCLRAVLHEPDLAAALAEGGRRTILERHTCAHRVAELLSIHQALRAPPHPHTRAAAGGDA